MTTWTRGRPSVEPILVCYRKRLTVFQSRLQTFLFRRPFT